MWYDENTYVLRTKDPQKLKDFLSHFGLAFKQEQHGDGPIHYSCQAGDKVLEIYPQIKKI